MTTQFQVAIMLLQIALLAAQIAWGRRLDTRLRVVLRYLADVSDRQRSQIASLRKLEAEVIDGARLDADEHLRVLP